MKDDEHAWKHYLSLRAGQAGTKVLSVHQSLLGGRPDAHAFLRKPGTTRHCFKFTKTCVPSIPAPFAPCSGRWKRNESAALLSLRRGEGPPLAKTLPNLYIPRGIPSFGTRHSASSSFETNTVPSAKVQDKKAPSPNERTGSHDYFSSRIKTGSWISFFTGPRTAKIPFPSSAAGFSCGSSSR